MFAEIILNAVAKQLNKTFDYHVPKELEAKIKLGDRVLIPFGNSKKLKEGFVVNLKKNSEFATKDIVSIQKDGLNEESIKLASLMSQMYFCNIFDAIKLMLPPGTASEIITNKVKEKTGRFVYLNKDIEDIDIAIETGEIKSPKQIRALEFLKDNDGIYSSDLQNFTDTNISVINALEKKGYIEIVEEQIRRNPFENKEVDRDKKLKLTEEQKNSFEKVKEKIEKNEYEQFLLYGVTGSRKNRNIFTAN